MIKKKNEGSELIDFQLSSDSQEILTLADRLIEEFNVTLKHIIRKKQILITLITNLIYNHLRGFDTAIPRGEKFYSNIPKRYKPENMSHDIVIYFIDKLTMNNKYAIERSRALKHEYGEVSKYNPSNLLMSLCKETLSNNYTLIEDECILLRKRVSNDFKIVDGIIMQTLQNSDIATDSEELTAEESVTSGLEDEGQVTRKYKKILMDYPETEYTQRIRSDLNEYNRFRITNSVSLKNLPKSMLLSEKFKENIQLFSSVDISKLRPDSKGNYNVPLAPDKLVRIFTEDFENGGRFYRGFETQLKKELRSYIAINGNSTVEFDYSSYHIRMLYHLKNKRCPDDPYTIFEGLDEDEGREYYKTMVASCLNNDNEKTVLRTMRHYIIKKGLRDYFLDITDKGLRTGLELLKTHNRHVARYFFQRDGLKFHRMDSDIANDILMYFTRRTTPILALCVHDSFIVPKEHEEDLKWAMNKFYRAKVHKLPKIK
ncbi:MAG TPA: hypothetical protein VIL99_06770 [Ignavibacteria bacterium]